MLASTNPGLIAAFGAGMLSFLSPCVLPLVPGYLSLMSGVSAAEMAVAETADTRRVVRSTALFVLGFTVVFTALGATAGAVGDVLASHEVVLNRVAGALVIVMGLLIAGVVSPRLLQQERRFHVLPSRLGGFAPPVMGMAFAFGWTPCIGPVLAGVLALAADQGTLTRGVVLLVSYSLGLGVPFILTGVAFARLTGAFGWVKRHFRVINVVSGGLLAAFGVLLLLNRVSRLSADLVHLMTSIGLERLTRI